MVSLKYAWYNMNFWCEETDREEGKGYREESQLFYQLTDHLPKKTKVVC